MSKLDKRSLIACKRCRSKKLRCDDRTPKTCQNCNKVAVPCILVDPVSKREFDREYVENLGDRARSLRAALGNSANSPMASLSPLTQGTGPSTFHGAGSVISVAKLVEAAVSARAVTSCLIDVGQEVAREQQMLTGIKASRAPLPPSAAGPNLRSLRLALSSSSLSPTDLSLTLHQNALHWAVYFRRPTVIWRLLAGGGYLGEKDILRAMDINRGIHAAGETGKKFAEFTVIQDLLSDSPPLSKRPEPRIENKTPPFGPRIDAGDQMSGTIMDLRAKVGRIGLELKRRPVQDIIYMAGPRQIMKTNKYDTLTKLSEHIQLTNKSRRLFRRRARGDMVQEGIAKGNKEPSPPGHPQSSENTEIKSEQERRSARLGASEHNNVMGYPNTSSLWANYGSGFWTTVWNIITCTTEEPASADKSFLEYVLERINSQRSESPVSAGRMVDLILGTAVSLAKTKQIPIFNTVKSSPFDAFQASIRSVRNSEAALFQKFQAFLDAENRQSQSGTSRGAESDNHYHSIAAETRILQEVKDICNELNILKNLVEDQQRVCIQATEVSLGAGHTRSRLSTETPSEVLREILGMIHETEGVQQAIDTLLDLKQKQANLNEAKSARKQAQDTAKQTDTIVVFAVVTIIFLPLSFLTSLFALNISNFPHEGSDVAYNGWWIFPILCMLKQRLSRLLD
ncbi:hypothetical protein BJX62DRAFT_232213 [Aspergillus germanicus]